MSVITTATVTAKTGPGVQATALALSQYSSFTADVGRGIVTFNPASGSAAGQKQFDLVGVTTFTVSISGGNYTLTVS